MLANLLLMYEKSDEAINTYMQLLDKKPDNFNALA
jgi:tetratricopeptide repeat protein 21B